MVTITNAIVTAYCACKLCCGPHATGLAANGKPPIEGITVAAPRWIPLGTAVTIRLMPLKGSAKDAGDERTRRVREEQQGAVSTNTKAEFTRPKRAKQDLVSTITRIAGDRTARRFDGRFDLYFASHQSAKQFGIRRAVVTLQIPNKQAQAPL